MRNDNITTPKAATTATTHWPMQTKAMVVASRVATTCLRLALDLCGKADSRSSSWSMRV